MNLTAKKFIVFVLGISLVSGLSMTAFSHETSGAATPAVQQADQAGTALQEGRRLLKRGKADLALGQLLTALNLYIAAKNRKRYRRGA